MSRSALRNSNPGAVPQSSKADAARPASPTHAVDGRVVDEVMSILNGHGLEVRAHAIRSAMQAKPDNDHVAAAETVVAWAKIPGYIRNPQAGVLLAAALKGQRMDDYSRAERWVRRVLPGEIPFYATLAAVKIRWAQKSGHTTPLTAESVLALLRRQGRDRASFVDCPDCPDLGRCQRCFGAKLVHRSEVTA